MSADISHPGSEGGPFHAPHPRDHEGGRHTQPWRGEDRNRSRPGL